MSPRRLAAVAVFALLFLGGIQPFFPKLLFRDNSALAESLARMPDAQAPGYPEFLARVRAATKNGDAILIIVPMRHWDEGYSYAYYRASYFLAGRRTVPMVNAEDALLRDNIAKADYVASWRVSAQLPGLETAWKTDDGMLLRRTR
jgi:hypothetical protein